MKPLPELLDDRKHVIASMKDVTDKAKKEERTLTEDEKREFDAKRRKIDMIELDIRKIEDTLRRDQDIADRGGAPRTCYSGPSTPGRGMFRGTLGRGTIGGGWRDARTGKEIRVMASGDRFADLQTRAHDGPAPSELSLGRLAVGMASGEWANAPAERRAMSETINTLGGFLVPNALSASVIDLARSKTVLIQAGATTIPMESGTLHIARVSTDPTTEIKQENAAFSGSDVSLDSIQLNAFTIGIMVTASRELIADAPNASDVIQNAIASALAVKLDYFGIRGSGSSEPTGLINMTGVNATGGVGSPDWDDVLTAIKDIEVDNGAPNAWICSPTCANNLRQLKVASEANHYGNPPAAVTDLASFVTTGIPDANLIVGDFSQLLIGLRQAPQMEISTEADNAFSKHQVLIKLTWRGDWAAAHPDHFTILSGIS